MKTKLFIALILLHMGLSQAAEPARLYTYEGQVAGVVCSVCSAHVKAALLNVEGIKEVKIRQVEGSPLPKITIITSSPTFTQEQAVKALGEKAKSYDIRNLNPVSH